MSERSVNSRPTLMEKHRLKLHFCSTGASFPPLFWRNHKVPKKKKSPTHECYSNCFLLPLPPAPPPWVLSISLGRRTKAKQRQRHTGLSVTKQHPPPPNPEPPPCSQALGFLHCPNREPWCRDREDHGNVGMRTDIKEESGKGEGIKGRDD